MKSGVPTCPVCPHVQITAPACHSGVQPLLSVGQPPSGNSLNPSEKRVGEVQSAADQGWGGAAGAGGILAQGPAPH